MRRALSRPMASPLLEIVPVARTRVPIIALHVLALAGEHHATERVRGGRIAADEAMRVAVDMQALVGATEAPSELLIRGSKPSAAASQALAISMARSAVTFQGCERSRFGGESAIKCGLREARAGILRGETRDATGLGHRRADGVQGKIRRAGRAFASAEIHGDAHAAVALVLEGFDFPQSHADRKTRILADSRFGLRRRRGRAPPPGRAR